MTRRIVGVLGALAGFVWWAGCGGGLRSQTNDRLILGQRLAVELVDGDQLVFPVELKAGDVIRVDATQNGVDVVLRVERDGTARDGDAEPLLVIDSLSGVWGPELLLFEAEGAGHYRLHLEAIEGRGTAVLEVVEWGQPSAVSRALMRAYAALETAWRGPVDGTALHSAMIELPVETPVGERGRLWWGIGQRLGAGGQVDEGADALERALDLLTGPDHRWERASLLNDTTEVYLKAGRLDDADRVIKTSLSHAAEVGHELAHAAAWGNRGVWHASLGDQPHAIEAYLESLEIARRVAAGAEALLTTINHNLGIAELNLGRLETGLDLLRRSEKGRRDGANPEAKAVSLSAQAWALSRLGRAQDAEASYGEAVDLLRAQGGGHSLAVLLEERASFLLDHGRPGEALQDLRESLGESSEDPLHRAYVAVQLGEASRQLGNLQESLEALRRGSAAFEDLGVRRGRLQAHVRLARSLRDSGEIDGARLELKAAIALAEGQRTELALGSFRRSFLAESHGAYAELVDLLASSGDAAAAFEVFEAGRARSLLDSLETAAEPPGEEEELAARIGALTERRLAAMQRGDGPLVEELAAEVRRRRQTLDRLEQARLTDLDSKRASPSPRSLEEIQRTLLGDGTTIWAFSLGQERSWLFRLDGASIEALERAPRAEIETAAEAVHGLLKQTWSPEIAVLADDALVRLADLTFEGIELGDGRLVWIVDGALQLVPFGLLPVQKGNARRLLLEDHELILAPSASVLAALERQADRRPAEKLLAITADSVFSRSDGRVAPRTRSPGLAWRFDRLPATAEEARRLGGVAAAYDPLVQSGFDARAAWVLSDAARDFRWLHFATHAFFDPRYPEQSGMVLSLVDRAGQPIDGLLTPGELRRLELEAELVVLSACETALGRQFEGEGVVGLAQAFFTGGASRLVASLWEVPDNELTVSLMEDFYRRLLAGETPPAALRAAQLKQHREGVSPGQWAAFVFIGPWSPLAPLPAGR